MTCGLPEVLQTKYFSFPFALQENAAAYFRIYSRRSEINPLLTIARPWGRSERRRGEPGPPQGARLPDNFAPPAAPPLPSATAPGGPRAPAAPLARGRRPPSARLTPRTAPDRRGGRPVLPRCAAERCGAYLRRGARGPAGSGQGPAGRRGRGGRSRAAPRGRGRRRGRRLPRRRWGGPAAAWAAPGSSRAPAPGSEAAR